MPLLVVTVEVPQLQFLDVVVGDGYRLSSTLPVEVSGHYFHEHLVTGYFFNACLDNCSMSAPGCFWTCCHFSYAKVHPGPEDDSGLALWRVIFKIADWRRVHR